LGAFYPFLSSIRCCVGHCVDNHYNRHIRFRPNCNTIGQIPQPVPSVGARQFGRRLQTGKYLVSELPRPYATLNVKST
jgi:hypothetical protein